MTAKLLTTMIANRAACWSMESCTRAVYGTIKKIKGNVRAQTLKQFKTPKRRATGGKMTNWMKPPTTPYIVKSVPIRPDSRPKPPENLKGRWVFVESGTCFAVCINIGRTWSTALMLVQHLMRFVLHRGYRTRRSHLHATECIARKVYAARFIMDCFVKTSLIPGGFSTGLESSLSHSSSKVALVLVDHVR